MIVSTFMSTIVPSMRPRGDHKVWKVRTLVRRAATDGNWFLLGCVCLSCLWAFTGLSTFTADDAFTEAIEAAVDEVASITTS